MYRNKQFDFQSFLISFGNISDFDKQTLGKPLAFLLYPIFPAIGCPKPIFNQGKPSLYFGSNINLDNRSKTLPDHTQTLIQTPI
jgi:hypothetical protein